MFSKSFDVRIKRQLQRGLRLLQVLAVSVAVVIRLAPSPLNAGAVLLKVGEVVSPRIQKLLEFFHGLTYLTKSVVR